MRAQHGCGRHTLCLCASRHPNPRSLWHYSSRRFSWSEEPTLGINVHHSCRFFFWLHFNLVLPHSTCFAAHTNTCCIHDIPKGLPLVHVITEVLAPVVAGNIWNYCRSSTKNTSCTLAMRFLAHTLHFAFKKKGVVFVIYILHSCKSTVRSDT